MAQITRFLNSLVVICTFSFVFAFFSFFFSFLSKMTQDTQTSVSTRHAHTVLVMNISLRHTSPFAVPVVVSFEFCIIEDYYRRFFRLLSDPQTLLKAHFFSNRSEKLKAYEGAGTCCQDFFGGSLGSSSCLLYSGFMTRTLGGSEINKELHHTSTPMYHGRFRHLHL